MKQFDDYYLFDLHADFHELVDLKHSQPDVFAKMSAQLATFRASIADSQANETECAHREEIVESRA
tara:strand:- start:7 stop:204 length:198 start_codon:yes stop_codon:yes gene_type:complete